MSFGVYEYSVSKWQLDRSITEQMMQQRSSYTLHLWIHLHAVALHFPITTDQNFDWSWEWRNTGINLQEWADMTNPRENLDLWGKFWADEDDPSQDSVLTDTGPQIIT